MTATYRSLIGMGFNMKNLQHRIRNFRKSLNSTYTSIVSDIVAVKRDTWGVAISQSYIVLLYDDDKGEYHVYQLIDGIIGCNSSGVSDVDAVAMLAYADAIKAFING